MTCRRVLLSVILIMESVFCSGASHDSSARSYLWYIAAEKVLAGLAPAPYSGCSGRGSWCPCEHMQKCHKWNRCRSMQAQLARHVIVGVVFVFVMHWWRRSSVREICNNASVDTTYFCPLDPRHCMPQNSDGLGGEWMPAVVQLAVGLALDGHGGDSVDFYTFAQDQLPYNSHLPQSS